MTKFRFSGQLEMTDCGPACLQMVLGALGKRYSLAEVRDKCNVTRVGVTFKDISTGAGKLGLDSVIGKVQTDQMGELPMPCILHWNQEHFVVLYRVEEKNGVPYRFFVADPGFGKITLGREEFEHHWKGDESQGVGMFFEKGTAFESIAPQVQPGSRLTRSWQFVRRHLLLQRRRLLAILILLGLSALISWVFPMLLTRLVDQGINKKQVHIVIAILGFQLSLVIGQLLIEWVRSLTSARFSAALSVSIITGFIRKLVRLPIRFFDTRLYTDILQKIDDHAHIEGFLSNMLLQFVFSLATFFFLSVLLASYSPLIFVSTLALSVASVSWILLFLKKRRYLDYARFRIRSDNRNVLFETILGMPEVKINNAQNVRYEMIRSYQERLYGLNVKATDLFQRQQIGVHSLSQLKNVVATFLCAYWVINGQMSLGVMMSIGYIIGQLSAPLDSFVGFFRSAQDANIAFNRLDEIQQKADENDATRVAPPAQLREGIELERVRFRYDGSQQPDVLHDISVNIPAGKVTAIVGSSGSGKTTLMKLLLSFYDPQEGCVRVDGQDLSRIDSDVWRDKCGVVLQDGYIFSGTIAQNIALCDAVPDAERLRKAAGIACILDFIEGLPLGFQTKIGKAGYELSGGQKQRILIARAVYKDPDIVFFDEATNALDAENERRIMGKLNEFFENKTVIVIAHRLSTVKNADQILVIEGGRIVDCGDHNTLTMRRGRYFELVRNQLELGA